MKQEKFFRFLFLIVPFIFLGTFGLGLISNQFRSIEPDNTTNVTNISFAIIIALSSVMFSWSRSIIENEKLRFFANEQGQRLLLSAILFLACAGFKYSIINLDLFFFFVDKQAMFVIKSILKSIMGLAFAFSFGLAFWCLLRTAMMLWGGFDYNKKMKDLM